MLSEKLKCLRVSRDLSIRKLAELSDVSKSTISDIESGKINPTVVTVEKLINCLGTTKEEFFKNDLDIEAPKPKDNLSRVENMQYILKEILIRYPFSVKPNDVNDVVRDMVFVLELYYNRKE